VDVLYPALFASMEEAVPPEQLEWSVGIPVACYFTVPTAPARQEVEMAVCTRAKTDAMWTGTRQFSRAVCVGMHADERYVRLKRKRRDHTKQSLKLLGIEV
jgi:hypothetical protein